MIQVSQHSCPCPLTAIVTNHHEHRDTEGGAPDDQAHPGFTHDTFLSWKHWVLREWFTPVRAVFLQEPTVRASRYCMCWPPLIAILDPVTKPASSEHR